MKNISTLILLLFSFISHAQVNDWEKYADSLRTSISEDGDIEKEYLLPELYINFSKEEMERIKIQNVLRRRILRVYPYAVMTGDNLTKLNENLAKLDSKSAKNRYLKRSEKYLKEQFEDRLKKLSRKDGQILVKLINRQTNKTTFDLVKEFKSGWSAFWNNQAAKMFDIDLKTKYNPTEVLEDFYIEDLIEKLRVERKINYRKPAKDLQMSKAKAKWKKELGDSGLYPPED